MNLLKNESKKPDWSLLSTYWKCKHFNLFIYLALTTVAIIGLLGNLLTGIVLTTLDRGHPNISTAGNGDTSFNIVLIFLGAFDSFYLFFSIFDDSYLRSFQMAEPYW